MSWTDTSPHRLYPDRPSSWPVCWQRLVQALQEGRCAAELAHPVVAEIDGQVFYGHPWPRAWSADVLDSPLGLLASRALVAAWMRRHVAEIEAASEEEEDEPSEDRAERIAAQRQRAREALVRAQGVRPGLGREATVPLQGQNKIIRLRGNVHAERALPRDDR